MIVDLTRNDLGRVARPLSVAVGPRILTSHPGVHHTSQRVTARLERGLDGWDLLRAAFPPGSVTGAPKVRAELEPEPRGVYCGVIGYASGPRHAWSVAIRTAVFHRGDARYHVGGGVVVDSTPEGEWQETIDKGRALATALTGHDAW